MTQLEVLFTKKNLKYNHSMKDNYSFYFLLLLSLFFSCNKKLSYDEKVDFIVIRTYDSIYGSYEIEIQNKKMVQNILNKTKILKSETPQQLKPFDYSIFIMFGQNSKTETSSYHYINKYSTSIIVKENNEYIISKADGNYRDDEYAKYIIHLLDNPPKDAEIYR